MPWEAWFTLGVIALVLIALVREIAPADMVLLGGAIAVTLAGIIRTEDFLAGFSNPGMITVAALFVVAAGLRETGALDRLGRIMLRRAKSERTALVRMSIHVTALSAFLNNTAVVAMLLPVITDWCRKNRVSASRMLLPLSHFTVLGGCITLIGTSTNLVVNGMMAKAAADPARAAMKSQLAPMGMFELTGVGLPCAIAGAIYMLTAGRKLLPQRRDLRESYSETSREYLVNVRVQPDCALIGKRISDAGLRHLPGLFLIEIVRGDRIIAPVEPNELISAGDILTFTGNVGTIVDLERIRGLVAVSEDDPQARSSASRDRAYCEAVISNTSPLIGRNIRDANFRALYNAAVVAVHRGGVRLTGRVGDIVLRSGDTLLLQAGPHFESAHRNNPDFYLVSSIEDARPVRHDRSWIAFGLLFVLIGLLASEMLNTAVSAFLIAGVMIATRCISPAEARRGINWDVLLAIAASFALGTALEKSGAAALLARGIVQSTIALGPHAALAAVYIAVMLLTELITNNAAAALTFPLALTVAQQLGVDPRPLIMAVTFAASFGFATPMGYQTNLMVFGPGGYRFTDFLRVGVPLDILCAIVAIILIPIVWPLRPL